jgi:hypothetical protein
VNTVELEFPASPSFNAVGRLVAGGLASRFDFAVPDIEDLQLALEALFCRPAAKGTLQVTLRHSDRKLQAQLGPFAHTDDRERVERMLLRLVDEVVVQDSSAGEWIVLHAPRQRATAPGSP